ncbi:hypothetical protein IMZ31_23960 (plasmid) [Pontibacillus sp. ALD_SL1]|uniref:hypothetical protein n=1 Tax=Pontibacillus sp. ALD_SL1 TaxID=2777185 RepID=UPI001A96C50B|nr:hypothetical protein [Pontibacillus sp. ALD_SL1]QST02508.1 hypothetical protein IMZ31_23960 [Pontibacillus sp. ALD_SL1]
MKRMETIDYLITTAKEKTLKRGCYVDMKEEECYYCIIGHLLKKQGATDEELDLLHDENEASYNIDYLLNRVREGKVEDKNLARILTGLAESGLLDEEMQLLQSLNDDHDPEDVIGFLNEMKEVSL